ncbi:hypothetical protein [Dokdonella sp.]|uniref:hypothetical protein n=1 Tax=Dokdonella sp. TaxID=2291710 RepID=UPI003784CDE1
MMLGCVAGCLSLLLAGAAYAADGELDATFSGDGVAWAAWSLPMTGAARIGPAADGRIVVAATVADGANRDFAAARFLRSGAPDAAFGFFGLRTIDIDLIADGRDTLLGAFVLADARTMLLGTAQAPGGAQLAALVRLTAAGDADPSFGSNGRRVIASAPWPLPDISIRAVARQTDGHYLFAGTCSNCPGARAAVVLRVDASGVADAAFGNGGWASLALPPVTHVEHVAVDAQGRIVLAGYEGDLANDDHNPLLARFLPGGSPDTAFGAGTGYVRLTGIAGAPVGGWIGHAAVADRDGSLLLALATDEDRDSLRAGIVRVHANGSRDTSFGSGGVLLVDLENGTQLDALALQSDRRIVAAGVISHSGSGDDVFVLRAHANGTLDASFDGNGVVRHSLDAQTDRGYALALVDGRPLIAGLANRGDSWDGFALRLTADLIFSDGLD